MAACPIRAQATRRAETLVVRRDPAGRGRVVDETFAARLRRTFRTRVHDVAYADGGHRLVTRAAPLAPEAADSAAESFETVVPAGLVPAAVEAAARLGISARVGRGPRPLGPHDTQRAARFEIPMTAMLEFAGAKVRGLVRYRAAGRRPAASPDGPDSVDLTAQIAVAFSGRRVAIVATRLRDIDRIHEAVRSKGVSAYKYEGRWHPAEPDRYPVSVGTPAALAADRWWDWNVLVCLDADEACAAAFRLPAVLSRVPRIFGLLPSGRCLDPQTEDLVRSHFGFEELALLPGGRVAPKVEIRWVRVGGGPGVDDWSPLALLDSGVWRNGLRNRLVAREARRAAGDGASVAVLAGSAGHAAALGRMDIQARPVIRAASQTKPR